MRLFRRLSRHVALVLSVVLTSVSLTSGRSTCMVSDGGPMSMPMSMHRQTITPDAASHGSAESPAPCHLPTSPHACIGMAACASVALPSIASAATAVHSATERAIDRTVELAVGDARAPELPPPRA